MAKTAEEAAAYHKKWYEEHKEEIAAKHLLNKEKNNAYSLKYYHDHKEDRLSKDKKYYEDNREELNAKDRARYPMRQERRKAQCKEWGEANKDRKKVYRETNRERDFNQILKRKYGWSREGYDAMLEKQQGKCVICRTTVPGKRKKHFTVDHDHLDGAIRGLLCQNCNSAIGFFKKILNLLNLQSST